MVRYSVVVMSSFLLAGCSPNHVDGQVRGRTLAVGSTAAWLSPKGGSVRFSSHGDLCRLKAKNMVARKATLELRISVNPGVPLEPGEYHYPEARADLVEVEGCDERLPEPMSLSAEAMTVRVTKTDQVSGSFEGEFSALFPGFPASERMTGSFSSGPCPSTDSAENAEKPVCED